MARGFLRIGARAAQVVPHVHFHIIPRVGDVPEVKARSWTVFGKGQREELDEGDAVVLVRRMRESCGRRWRGLGGGRERKGLGGYWGMGRQLVVGMEYGDWEKK